MFHNLPDEPDVLAESLVRSTDVEYSHEETSDAASDCIYSFPLFVSQYGNKGNNGSYLRRCLPPVAFTRPIVQDVVEEDGGADDLSQPLLRRG